MGQDRLNAAFTEMMREDPKADALLDQAMDKFEVGRVLPCLPNRPFCHAHGQLCSCRYSA